MKPNLTLAHDNSNKLDQLEKRLNNVERSNLIFMEVINRIFLDNPYFDIRTLKEGLQDANTSFGANFDWLPDIYHREAKDGE